MASGAAQQTFTLSTGTIVTGDLFNIVINGVTYTYTAVGADNGSGTPAVITRMAAALNLQPAFAALYTADASQGTLTLTVFANNNSYNASVVSSSHTGTGLATFIATKAFLVGGDGGANIGLQTSGGAQGGQAIFPVMAAGFNSPIGATYINSTQG